MQARICCTDVLVRKSWWVLGTRWRRNRASSGQCGKAAAVNAEPSDRRKQHRLARRVCGGWMREPGGGRVVHGADAVRYMHLDGRTSLYDHTDVILHLKQRLIGCQSWVLHLSWRRCWWQTERWLWPSPAKQRSTIRVHFSSTAAHLHLSVAE